MSISGTCLLCFVSFWATYFCFNHCALLNASCVNLLFIHFFGGNLCEFKQVIFSAYTAQCLGSFYTLSFFLLFGLSTRDNQHVSALLKQHLIWFGAVHFKYCLTTGCCCKTAAVLATVYPASSTSYKKFLNFCLKAYLYLFLPNLQFVKVIFFMGLLWAVWFCPDGNSGCPIGVVLVAKEVQKRCLGSQTLKALAHLLF